MDFILKFKTAIYVVGFVACVLAYAMKPVHAIESEEHFEAPVHGIDLFWPPDMIPHPHIPDPKPADNMA